MFRNGLSSLATMVMSGETITLAGDPNAGFAGAATALGTGPEDGIGCRQSSYIQGWVEEYDVSSWNIGTTSIFTSSNPIVQGLGADVGVFVTDIQGVVVPNIYEERGAPLAYNKCR